MRSNERRKNEYIKMGEEGLEEWNCWNKK